MDDDQQYCLRWNNHQSTLISVFDTLLENETLVDCTLAAEGKILKAHKVVLSACSPYFATLLQEQYDKHPVFILKDVKYQELRAMMDYMYRGEVNISQDQLAALLKAAESLQIKGLSDNRAGSSAAAAAPKPEQHLRGKMGTGYTLEQTKRARMATGAMDAQDVSGSREGSSSPSRRRRKVRRRSMENDAHDNSNSSVMQAAASNQLILQQSNAASALVATQMPIAAGVSIAPGSAHTSATGVAGATQGTTQQQVQPLTTTSVNKKTDSAKGITTSISTAAAAAQQSAVQTSEVINTENVQVASGSSQCGAVIVGVEEQDVKSSGDKANHKQKLSKEATTSAGGSEMVIEPKAEYDDEGHEETVEDLTLDDEEIGMEELDQTAGTSQGGEGSSQGYAAWQHDRSQEELLLATQEAQQRDPQGQTELSVSNIMPVSSRRRHYSIRGLKSSPITSPIGAPIGVIKYEPGLGPDENDYEHEHRLGVLAAGVSSTLHTHTHTEQQRHRHVTDDDDDDDEIDDDDNMEPCDLRLNIDLATVLQHPVALAIAAAQTSGMPPQQASKLQQAALQSITHQHQHQLQQQEQQQMHQLLSFPQGTRGTSSPPRRYSSSSGGIVAAAQSGTGANVNTPNSTTAAIAAAATALAANNSSASTSVGGASTSAAAIAAAAIGVGATAHAVGSSGGGGGSSSIAGSSSTANIAANVTTLSNPSGGVPTGSSGGSWSGAYTCDRCGNSYARPHSLNRHVRFECGVEPKFECPICHKKSKHKHNLVLHMRTHQHR